MVIPRWLAGLPVSLALHVVLAGATVAWLRAERAPTALIIDLNAIVAGHDDGPGSGARAPTPPASTSARGVARPPASARSSALPLPSPRAAVAPRPTTPDAEPDPVPERAPDPPRNASRDVAPPAPSVATAPSSSEPPASTSVASASASGTSRSSRPGVVDGATSSPSGYAAGGGAIGDRGDHGAGGDQFTALTPGTGGVGLGVGTEYAAYLARLRQRIQEGLRYPPVARRRGVTGTVQLEIAIDRAGAIADVSVIGSSSHEVLDRAAVDAARALARQPFPADVRPRPLKVRLPVVFELQ